MASYLFAYTGGNMAQTDAEREAAMAAGTVVRDARFRDRRRWQPLRSLRIGGLRRCRQRGQERPQRLFGADGRQPAAATELAKDCPVIANGGAVDVYETIPVM